MKDSRKQFIKDGHKAACSEWKTKIEKEFPKLFKETELVVGKWHKDKWKHLINYQLNRKCYGFNNGDWDVDTDNCFYSFDSNSYWTTATDKEVEDALIKEAKKIGFKEGVSFKGVYNGQPTTITNLNLAYHMGALVSDLGSRNGSSEIIFKDGKWATIIETITKAEAEKELGKTII